MFRAIRHRLGELHELTVEGGSVHLDAALSDIYTSAEAAALAESDLAAVAAARGTVSGIVAERLRVPSLSTVERSLLEHMAATIPDAVADDPFEALLRDIGELSRDIYRDAWIPPRLELAWRRRHPRPNLPVRDPYALTASTYAAGSPTIEVSILVQRFGPAGYAAVPALLVHECVCHVAARQAGEVDNTSTFAEGFMDWVAGYFLEAWMALIDEGLANAALVHGYALRAILSETDSDASAARLEGSRGARDLAITLERDVGISHFEALARTARLGIELNVVDVPLPYKDAFIARIRRPADRHMVDALSDWVEGRVQAAELL
jgi:hypothetical protein